MGHGVTMWLAAWQHEWWKPASGREQGVGESRMDSMIKPRLSFNLDTLLAGLIVVLVVLLIVVRLSYP